MYQVGGSIRDSIMGLASHDIDYCVEAASYNMMSLFIQSKGFKITSNYEKFNTCKAQKDGKIYDLSLCHDELGNPCNIGEDLKRRDFTFNAIAKDVSTQKIIDPFDGVKDAEDKIIRCIGDIGRIIEDPLRLFRAMRFAITKNAVFEERIETIFYDEKYISKILNVPTISARQELNKCFTHDSKKTLEFLEKYPLMRNMLFQLPLRIKMCLKEE